MKTIPKTQLLSLIETIQTLEKYQNKLFDEFVKENNISKETEEWLWDIVFNGFPANSKFCKEKLKNLGYKINYK